MESRYGPLGLRQEYTYNEVMRAISEQPLKLEYPKRVGLRTYEDIFFSNLINDQAAYQGDSHARGGFSHEQPRQPPARPDVYFDSRSDGGDDGYGGGGGGGRGGGGGDDAGDGQGPWHYPFGRHHGNMPIQSGQMLPDMGPPLQLPDMPNPRHNYIQEEGLQLPPEPPGFFGQAGQAAGSGFQEGAVNRVTELGVLAGGMAADMAANRMRALGGAVRDGALNYADFYFREFPGLVANFVRGRPPPPPNEYFNFAEASQALRGAEFGAAEAGGAEAAMAMGAAEAGGMAAGALEGAELGALGGPLGVAAGAAVGGIAGQAASLMFRDRAAPAQQSTFLDARSLNNQNQSVRPLQPRFNRYQEGGSSGSNEGFNVPSVYNIASREASADNVMRPTTAPTPRMRERSAQSVIDGLPRPSSSGGDVIRSQSRVRFQPSQAPIEGEPNPGMLADRAPQKNSYADIMRSTAAPTSSAAEPRRNKRMGGNSGSPYAFPFSGAPALPAAPSSSASASSRNRSRGGTAPTPAPKAAAPKAARRNREKPPKKDGESKRDQSK